MLFIKLKKKFALMLKRWYILSREFLAVEVKTMSRKCPITGKGPLSGNNRSHSVRATRRVWNVNMQTYKVNINGQMVSVKMSARAYRTLNKSIKAVDAE